MLNDTSSWNWTTIFNLNGALVDSQRPSVGAACRDLLILPFEQGLQMIVTTVPRFDHKQWRTFHAHLSTRRDNHPHIDTWLLFAELIREGMDDIWEVLSYDVERATTTARRKLAKMGDTERLAWMACLHYHAQSDVQAHMLFQYLLPIVTPDAERMQRLIAFYRRLTPRQQQVAAYAARGLTNSEIADALHIESSVVSEHLTAIYRAFETALQVELDQNARRYRLVHWLTRLFERNPHLLLNGENRR